MTYINKICSVLNNPYKIFVSMAKHTNFSWLSDEKYLSLYYRGMMGKKLDLEHPKTFNEKLQWLKLYDRNPLYTKMVDKYEVRDYISSTIGEQYLIPCLGVWDSVEDIDISTLPEQFVLKCTHDSHSVVICTDKGNFDWTNEKKKLAKALKRNFYYEGRQWSYKDVKPRIIAEQYMVDESGVELKDYKLFCFNGFARAMFIASDRQIAGEDTKFDFYDMDFKRLPIKQGHPNSNRDIKRPESFERMKSLAEKLSEKIPFVRVDFYDINGQVYFGELTFFHYSGFVGFEPEEWDTTFGEWIKLPDSLGGGY